jgi:hypothetical protein
VTIGLLTHRWFSSRGCRLSYIVTIGLLPHIQVVRIQRVQNLLLWRRYCMECDTISQLRRSPTGATPPDCRIDSPSVLVCHTGRVRDVALPYCLRLAAVVRYIM